MKKRKNIPIYTIVIVFVATLNIHCSTTTQSHEIKRAELQRSRITWA